MDMAAVNLSETAAAEAGLAAVLLYYLPGSNLYFLFLAGSQVIK